MNYNPYGMANPNFNEFYGKQKNLLTAQYQDTIRNIGDFWRRRGLRWGSSFQDLQQTAAQDALQTGTQQLEQEQSAYQNALEESRRERYRMEQEAAYNRQKGFEEQYNASRQQGYGDYQWQEQERMRKMKAAYRKQYPWMNI